MRALGERAERSPRSARRARGSAPGPRARAVLGRRLVPSAMILDRIGSAKAAVLPEPVWAMPRMSRPASCAGMALIWIGFGSVKPAETVAFSSGPVMPSAAKPRASAPDSVFNIQFLLLSRGIRPQNSGGRAQPAVQIRFMKRQGGGQIARAAALSCPPGSSERGSFAATEMFGGRKQTQPVPRWEKPEVRPKRLCRRIWWSSRRKARIYVAVQKASREVRHP